MATKKEIIEAVERLQKALLDEYELKEEEEKVGRKISAVHYEVLNAKEAIRALSTGV
jgi:hypothetical protein